MADIGTATVRVTPNMTGIQGKIAAGFKGSAGPATSALGDEVEKNSGPFQAALGKLGGFAKAAGIAIGAGLLAGAAGLTALTGKALMAGAELEQQLGGSEAVFGEYAKGIQDAATKAYETAGLSQQEFLQGANKMGSLFQGAGFDVQSSMQMSSDSMQRASDIASIMGISTTEALEAVTGMAKGNFTMMDTLGVAMNDTAIGAYAASKGINKSTQAMSIQEKVGLAQQMFMEKTAKYAGNYAKENMTLSGSINTTKKAFDNLLTGQGSVEGFINSMINTINIAIPQIVALLPKIVTAISAILTALVPAISAALPVLIPALIQAVTDLIMALVAAFPTILEVLLQALPLLIDAFIQLFLAIIQALPQIIDTIVKALPQIIDAIVTSLTSPESLTALILATIELFFAIVKALPQVITAIVRALPTILSNIVKTLTSPQFINGLIGAGVELMKSMITGILNMYGAIGSSVGQIVGIIASTLSPGNLARIGADLVRGLWNGISDMVGWITGKIRSFGQGVLNGIKSFFGIQSPSTVFADIGNDLDRGLAKGILNGSGVVDKAIDSLASDALGGMLDANLGMESSFSSSPVYAGDVASPVNVGTIIIEKDVDIDLVANKLGIKQLNTYRGIA